MAENTNTPTSGFNIPLPGSSQEQTPTSLTLQMPNAFTPFATEDTSSRDLMIGGAVLLVLLLAFFFAKGGYANSLVSKRVPPNRANTAGWWLFVFLGTLSTGVVLAAVSASRFMTPFILGPLVGISIMAFILLVMSSRK